MEKIVRQTLPPSKRGLGKYKSDYGVDELFKFYCEKYGNKYNLTRAEFTKILRRLNDKKFHLIINKAWEYKMPYRMGIFRIRKRKIKFRLDENNKLDTKYLSPDWEKTLELWYEDEEARKQKKLIYHFNEHSNGYKYPWFWDKRTSNAINQSLYQVKITRTHNRQKNYVIKNNSNIDYFE